MGSFSLVTYIALAVFVLLTIACFIPTRKDED